MRLDKLSILKAHRGAILTINTILFIAFALIMTLFELPINFLLLPAGVGLLITVIMFTSLLLGYKDKLLLFEDTLRENDIKSLSILYCNSLEIWVIEGKLYNYNKKKNTLESKLDGDFLLRGYKQDKIFYRRKELVVFNFIKVILKNGKLTLLDNEIEAGNYLKDHIIDTNLKHTKGNLRGDETFILNKISLNTYGVVSIGDFRICSEGVFIISISDKVGSHLIFTDIEKVFNLEDIKTIKFKGNDLIIYSKNEFKEPTTISLRESQGKREDLELNLEFLK